MDDTRKTVEDAARREALGPLMLRRDYGTKQGTEGEEPDPKIVAESLKEHPEFLRAIQQVLKISDAGKKYVPDAMAQRMSIALRDMGVLRKEAATDSTDPQVILQSMKDDPGFNEVVRKMLNERLVSSIGEARRLADAGVTVEELKKIRGGRDMSKGKWASKDIAKRLDTLADQLEMHGMREAAEKLDVLSNTIEAATLVGKPYIVEQLEKAGFVVSEHPGFADVLREHDEAKKDLQPKGKKTASVWDIQAPADKVFDVEGIEQEEVSLVIDPNEGEYIVAKSWPAGHPRPLELVDRGTLKTLIHTDKEQELISKLKKMVKPKGVLKMAAKYLETEAVEEMTFPIHLSENPEHPELKKVFTWLSRHKMGPAFGSRPIGWYQQHQMAALDIIEDAVKKSGSTGEVRVEKGMVMAKKDGGWQKLMSCDEVYKKADENVRK